MLNGERLSYDACCEIVLRSHLILEITRRSSFISGRAYRPQSALNIILGVVMTLIAVIVVIVCVIHRRRKARREKKKKEIEVRYMTRSASEDRDGTGVGSGTGTRTGSRDAISINSGQNLFKEQTEKVSIV